MRDRRDYGPKARLRCRGEKRKILSESMAGKPMQGKNWENTNKRRRVKNGMVPGIREERRGGTTKTTVRFLMLCWVKNLGKDPGYG